MPEPASPLIRTFSMRSALLVVFAAIFCLPLSFSQTETAPAPSLTEDQIRAMIRQAADKDIENQKAQRNYTYTQREEQHKLDGKGEVKSTETRTYEILVLYDDQVRKQIAKDDKPLSEKDAAKEEEKLQKIIDKREKESDDDRKKRIAASEKGQEEGREFVKEIADAYNFTVVGSEPVNGREAWIVDARPRPGYEPHMKNAKFLPKFQFRVWIDQKEQQWVKIDAKAIDTVSVGLFLFRLHKDSNVQIELLRINDEVWLPKHVALRIGGRIALLKGLNMSMDVTYRDYKKFTTDTKIVGVSEVPEQK